MKNNFITKIIGATLAFAMMIGGAVGIFSAQEAKMVDATTSTTTYTFSSKAWAASPANWTSGKDGNQFSSGRGVQITKGTTGANATSPSSYTNISQIVVTYSTNATAGAGSVSLKVGTNAAANQNVTTEGGTSDRTLSWDYSPRQSGSVTITVTCTTNSIYVKSVAVVTEIVGQEYTVTYHSNGGTEFAPAVVAENGTITNLPSPEKAKNENTQTRYEFEGWYKEDTFDNRFTSETQVTSNLDLYANYTEYHYNLVRFHTNGGSEVETQEVDNGGTASEPVSSKDNYALEGWYREEALENRFDFATTITNQNIDLYAKWAPIAIQENGVFVKITSNEGLVNNGKYLITYNDTYAFNSTLNNVDATPNTVAVELNGEYIVKNDNVKSSYVTIDAEHGYIRTAKGKYIGYNATSSNGINAYDSASATCENNISFSEGHLVVTRVIDNKTMTLSYNTANNQQKFRYFLNAQQPIDLYRFVKTYTVSFVTNSATSNIDDVLVFEGETLTLPADPTKEADAEYSYTFAGWYEDSNFATPFVQSNPITSDLTLYAKYSQEAISSPTTYLNTASSITTLLASENTQSQSGVDEITFSDEGYDDKEVITSFSIGNVSVSASKAEGSTSPAYYNTGTALRIYGKNTLTFSSQTNITRIEFTDVDGNRISNCSASTGTLSNTTWTGSATSVTFTNNNTSGHYRIESIAVTYGKTTTTTVTEAGLRFSAAISKTAWAAIEENWDITDYGYMLFKTDSLQGLSETPVKDRYTNSGALAEAHSNTGNAPAYEEGDNYVFSVKVTVSTYSKYFCAAPFIVIDDVYYFLTEQQKSVKGMAADHITNGGTTISAAALAILAA